MIFITKLTFDVFKRDKLAAINREWRVSEHKLLTLVLFGGSIGAYYAQHRLRHKTRKEPFRSVMNFIVILQILTIGFSVSPLRDPVAYKLRDIMVSLAPSTPNQSGKIIPRRFGPGS